MVDTLPKKGKKKKRQSRGKGVTEFRCASDPKALHKILPGGNGHSKKEQKKGQMGKKKTASKPPTFLPRGKGRPGACKKGPA